MGKKKGCCSGIKRIEPKSRQTTFNVNEKTSRQCSIDPAELHVHQFVFHYLFCRAGLLRNNAIPFLHLLTLNLANTDMAINGKKSPNHL